MNKNNEDKETDPLMKITISTDPVPPRPVPWEAGWIRWHTDDMTFQTMREAHEWAYSEAYNEIGWMYDGYRTSDEKVAYALVFELIRANTLCDAGLEIFTDIDWHVKPLAYLVWVKRTRE